MWVNLVTMSLILGSVRGLQWAENLEKSAGKPVELCSGQNIQLLWNFTLNQGERLKGMLWECQPEGEEESVMATYTDGHFVPMASFSGRLAHLQHGGIELSCATILESGNYSVAVSVEDEANSITVHHKTASVLVLDMPKTVDGELRVTMDEEAVRDVTSGTWHVQLSCGNFSDRGHPPVDVVWTTPTGESLGSSNYSEGFFHLLLDNPVVGGNYSCSLGPRQPARSCLDSRSPLLGKGEVGVEETTARFTLLEARQQEIALKLQNQAEKVTVLEEAQQMARDNGAVEKARWTDSLEKLTNRMSAQELQLGERTQSFHARLTSSIGLSEDEVLKLTNVISNQGNGYSPYTGYFTAPGNGTYFFIGTTASYSTNGWANMRLRTGKSVLSETYLNLFTSPYSGSSKSYSMGSCHGVVYLNAGEKVWLESSDDSFFRKDVTSFSGFRID